MRLLVTGGCGFVGSNFIRYVLQHYGPEMITNVDSLASGRLENLPGVAETYGDRYEFLRADAADGAKIEALLAKHQFFAVVHFAAESSNATATMDLLERARRHGVRRFLLVSRDHAGKPLEAEEEAALNAFRENREEVVIMRATDNYGPYQSPDALIPRVIIQALRDEKVRVDGDGSQTHDWLHVEDHCAALFAAILDGKPGSTYRIATGHELKENDLVERILEHLGKSRELIEYVPASETPNFGREIPVGEAGQSALAWKPRRSLDQGLRETIDWYVRNPAWWEAAPGR